MEGKLSLDRSKAHSTGRLDQNLPVSFNLPRSTNSLVYK